MIASFPFSTILVCASILGNTRIPQNRSTYQYRAEWKGCDHGLRWVWILISVHHRTTKTLCWKKLFSAKCFSFLHTILEMAMFILQISTFWKNGLWYRFEDKNRSDNPVRNRPFFVCLPRKTDKEGTVSNWVVRSILIFEPISESIFSERRYLKYEHRHF